MSRTAKKARATSASGSRREKALATRRRMLLSAYELFCDNGYAATTMEAIARRAGVAVQTLYFTFHTKLAILNEAVGAAILGFERWDPRAEPAAAADPRKALAELHAWFPAFERASSQREALSVFVGAASEITARVAPLVSMLAEAASTDPVAQRLGAVGEQRRVEGYRLVVEMLAARGGLRRGTSVQKATDVVLAIVSAETWQHLVRRRGWSPSACRRFMLDVLVHQLLPGGEGAPAARRAPAVRA